MGGGESCPPRAESLQTPQSKAVCTAGSVDLGRDSACWGCPSPVPAGPREPQTPPLELWSGLSGLAAPCSARKVKRSGSLGKARPTQAAAAWQSCRQLLSGASAALSSSYVPVWDTPKTMAFLPTPSPPAGWVFSKPSQPWGVPAYRPGCGHLGPCPAIPSAERLLATDTFMHSSIHPSTRLSLHPSVHPQPRGRRRPQLWPAVALPGPAGRGPSQVVSTVLVTSLL